ncbi:MAG TPA: lysozyme inhibitor LprI family protein [Pyrinomonadaceae bacterium]|nr:lysozyme inhibitor LprI family protein [Pyrinomonadaceae bacterium]
MRKLLLALISILLLTSLSTAQEQPQHPIDKALDACIDKNGSTAGMVECTDKAYAAWDKELNKNYGELMRALNPKQKEALRLAQLEWIKYRDLEFKSIDSVYDTLEGTMYIPMRISAHLEVIKKRALELKDRLDLIKDS